MSNNLPNKKKFLKNRRFRAQKKPILAGGIIAAVAIAGIIAGVYFFSVDLYPSHDYIVPGVSPPPLDQIVKIGLLTDTNHLFGDHAWKGCLLAATEINEQGGILINGTRYYIGLIRENTKEFYPGVIADAENATNHMIDNHHPHFITGGFSGGPLLSYLEIIMERKIPFIVTGSAAEPPNWPNILDDYERYKYLFRNMPMNRTSIFKDLIHHIISLAKYLNATYGGTVDKIGILYENTNAGIEFSNTFYNVLPNFNLTVVKIPYNGNSTSEDFEDYWNQIETAQTQITMIFNMYLPRAELIAKAYKAVQPRCLLFSPINHKPCEGPYWDPYWDNVEGACQFEILSKAIYNTSKTSLTIPFFNSFINEYGIEPIYPGVGSYDAVYLLAHAVNDSQSFDSDTIVSTLEKINKSNPSTGVGGNLAFTSSHDVLRGYPHGYGLLCQYKYIDGTKEVIPSDEVYPDFIATDSLRLPYWGINGLLTDPPQPPGNFSMNSTAGTSDYDGQFNLNWTDSAGADNYSIYMSDNPDNPITYISKKFDLCAYQTTIRPFPISLKKGNYYFRVVAYNKTGERMSSNYVYVNIPGPGPFNVIDNADDPDTDGIFDLIWDDSERADNYSVYYYKSEITTINESLTLLANQINETSFAVTGLRTGKYYFAIAAYNKMGFTLSDVKVVVVQLPPNWKFILVVLISSIAGLASIVLVREYLSRKSKIEKVEDKHKLKKESPKNNINT